MGTLRTRETEEAYRSKKEAGVLRDGCPLCKAESIKEFDLWRIIDNKYPYDLVADVHHMIIPKRHAPDKELTFEEKAEFESIKDTYLHDAYEFMIEPCRHKKSIPEHSHLHMIIAKDQ